MSRLLRSVIFHSRIFFPYADAGGGGAVARIEEDATARVTEGGTARTLEA